MTMKPNEMTPSVARNNQYQAPFTSGRWLDPIRAAALHEAVKAVAPWPEPRLNVTSILSVAHEFERWLAGTDEDSP